MYYLLYKYIGEPGQIGKPLYLKVCYRKMEYESLLEHILWYMSFTSKETKLLLFSIASIRSDVHIYYINVMELTTGCKLLPNLSSGI